MSQSPITTHVLDTALGKPAAGVHIQLFDADSNLLGEGKTNGDGRLPDLLPAEGFEAGRYAITFDTGGYFAATDRAGFYPTVRVDFEVVDAESHYHVPLLISPFGYSTYRGS